MLVLALDTSTPAVSVALVRRGTGAPAERSVLAEHTVVDARRHGELLAVGIRSVLAAAGCSPTSLAAVAVGLGPGPFTGLRVGVVTAASLSDALGIPAYGLCSLDALGEGARLAVTDARRREVYWARYDESGARVDGPHVSPPAELVLDGAVVLGDGALAYPAVFGEVPAEPRYPSAVRIAQLVDMSAPAVPLVPLYLRRPDAEQPGPPKRVTA